MPSFQVLTATEQVADHLREELFKKTWTETMPGGAKLAKDLGIGHMTVEAALATLEKEGLLISRGRGRRREIVLPDETNDGALRPLRIAILPFLPGDLRVDYIVELQHMLGKEEHSVVLADRSMNELGMDLGRITKLVGKIDADAWVIIAGSRDVLEWFANSPTPAFALFGRRRGLSLAGTGPDKITANKVIVNRLLELGHRRISMIARPLRRIPEPGLPEKEFLNTLESAGIQTGPYNLPDWNGTIASLHQRLNSMFVTTPPTALIIEEPPLYFSVQNFLARRGILAPERVSLICTDGDSYFESLRPTVSHIKWDSRPWGRYIVRWANGVSRGRNDRRQILTKADFVEGGSIGPAP